MEARTSCRWRQRLKATSTTLHHAFTVACRLALLPLDERLCFGLVYAGGMDVSHCSSAVLCVCDCVRARVRAYLRFLSFFLFFFCVCACIVDWLPRRHTLVHIPRSCAALPPMRRLHPLDPYEHSTSSQDAQRQRLCTLNVCACTCVHARACVRARLSLSAHVFLALNRAR